MKWRSAFGFSVAALICGLRAFDPDPECNTGTYVKNNTDFADPLYMWNCEGDFEFRLTDGFKRPQLCVPGSLDNTCIIPVFEPKTLAKAAESCLFEYGGRLAVAVNEESNDLWLQAVWRYPGYSGTPSIFWIGAALDNYARAHKFFSVTDYRSLRYLPMEIWRQTFSSSRLLERALWPMSSQRPGGPFNGDMNCPSWGIALNATEGEGKWYIDRAYDKMGYLCEAPRWPELRCKHGWQQMMYSRMCLKPVFGQFSMPECRDECRKIGGDLAADRGKNRYYIIAVIEPLLSRGSFYFGSKSSTDNSGVCNLDGSHSGMGGDKQYRCSRTLDHIECASIWVWYRHYTNCANRVNCLCQRMTDFSKADLIIN